MSEIEEIIARAIKKANATAPDYPPPAVWIAYYVTEALADAGFVIVPKDGTVEMFRAGQAIINGIDDAQDDACDTVYRAMLAASPK